MSEKTIVSRHPWVENSDVELENLKKEKEESEKEISDMFPKNAPNNPDDDQGGEE